MDKITLGKEEISDEEEKDNHEQYQLETEIQWALRVKNYKKIDLLLSEDSRKFGRDSSGSNPFILACRGKHSVNQKYSLFDDSLNRESPVLTSFLHKVEDIIKEFFSLGVIIQLIKLEKKC